jgi:hypothetical protein
MRRAFPRIGKQNSGFPKDWKISPDFFQGLEKRRASVSKVWKTPRDRYDYEHD